MYEAVPENRPFPDKEAITESGITLHKINSVSNLRQINQFLE
jgi:hypothetical protein